MRCGENEFNSCNLGNLIVDGNFVCCYLTFSGKMAGAGNNFEFLRNAVVVGEIEVLNGLIGVLK